MSFEFFYSVSLPVDELCLSPASMGAIIVSDDESSGA